MSDPDRELEAFLARRRLLPRADTPEEQWEPSPELDQAVLARARAAVERGDARKPFRRQVWVPLAYAAALVLSLTIVLQVYRPQGPTTADFSTKARIPPVIEAQPLSATEAPAQPAPAERASASAPAESADAAAPAERVSAPRRVERALAFTPEERASESAPAERTPEPALAGRAPETTPAEREPTREWAPAAAAVADESYVDDPAEWLKRIEKLRAEGRTEEAARELQEFRARYPASPAVTPAQEAKDVGQPPAE